MKADSTQRRSRGLTCAALAVALALAGCQTAGGVVKNPFDASSQQSSAALPMSAAEQEMLADQERFNETVISAVLTGALVGAAACAAGALLFGKRGSDVGKSAVICGVAGGAIAGIDGYVTAKNEQASRQKIRATQAAANDMRQDNQRLQAYIDSSNRVLAEGKARLASLKRDVAAKKLSTDEARQAREREERNIASMNETLKQARNTRDQYVEASAKMPDTPQNKRDLDAEIRRMNQQIAQLEANVSAYNQALQVSRA